MRYTRQMWAAESCRGVRCTCGVAPDHLETCEIERTWQRAVAQFEDLLMDCETCGCPIGETAGDPAYVGKRGWVCSRCYSDERAKEAGL